MGTRGARNEILHPHSRGEAESGEILTSIRRFLARQDCHTTDRRIRRLAYTHGGEAFDLHVGGHHPGMEDDPELTGYPWLVGLNSVTAVEDFDEARRDKARRSASPPRLDEEPGSSGRPAS